MINYFKIIIYIFLLNFLLFCQLTLSQEKDDPSNNFLTNTPFKLFNKKELHTDYKYTIDSDKLETYNYNSLKDIIGHIPSTVLNENEKDIIYSFSSKEALYLLNGKRTSSYKQFFSIPVSKIYRIQIEKGKLHPKYGGGDFHLLIHVYTGDRCSINELSPNSEDIDELYKEDMNASYDQIEKNKRIEKYLTQDDRLLISLQNQFNGKYYENGMIKQHIKNSPDNIYVITRKEIERYGYTSLEEVLENSPGLFLIKGIHQRTNLGSRGLWLENKNFEFLLNGNQLTTNYVNTHLCSIPVELIDKIEISKNNGSLSSHSFVGAINIVTNEFNKNRVSLLYNNKYGTKGFSCKTNKVFNDDKSISINAGITDSDGQEVSIRQMSYYFDPRSLKLENENKHIDISFKKNSFFTDLIYNNSTYKSCSPSYDNIMHDIDYFVGSCGLYFPLTQNKMKISYYRYDKKLDLFLEDNKHLNSKLLFERFSFSWIKSGHLRQDLRASLKMNINRINKINNETDYRFYDYYVNGFSQWSICGNFDYSYNNNLKLSGSVKFDIQDSHSVNAKKISAIDELTIPNFCIVYSLKEGHVLKYIYKDILARPYYLDEINVSSNQFNSHELNYLILNDIASINFSVYYNHYYDIIYLGDKSEIDTYGFEFITKVKPKYNFMVEFSTNFNHSDLTNDSFNTELSFSPNSVLHLKAVYYFNEKRSFSVSVKQVNDMKKVITGINRDLEVGSYLTYDASLRIHDIFRKDFFLNIHLSNIFNKEYFYPAVNNSWQGIGTPGNEFLCEFIFGLEY